MSSRTVFSLLLLFSVLQTASADSAERDREDADFTAPTARTAAEVATRCCRQADSGCCQRSVEFFLPLDCGHWDIETKVINHNCVRRELFGKEPKSFFEESFCCDIFRDDPRDRDGICFSQCRSVLQTPSYSSREQMQRIFRCRHDNKRFSCFRKCVGHVHAGGSGVGFPCGVLGRSGDRLHGPPRPVPTYADFEADMREFREKGIVSSKPIS